MSPSDDREALKRRQARRSRWTAIMLALFALAVYLGFFWKMDHYPPAGEGSASVAHSSTDGARHNDVKDKRG